jgi:hypothetical protein
MAIDAGRLEALRNIAAMQGRAISPEELVGAGVPWQEVQNYGGSSLPGPVQGVNFQELDRILNAAATSGKQISPEQWSSVGGPSHLYSYLYGEPPVDPGRVNRTTNDPLAGVPTYPIPSETVTGAFGKEATPNVQSLDEIYRSLMPLVQLNTAPQAEQELALKNLQGITAQDAATARQGDIAGRALWDKAMGGDPRQEQALDDLNRMSQQSRQYDPRIDDYISRLQTLSNEGLNAGERRAIR